MVRVETMAKILGVISMFGEANPYDIHAVTMMNYESIRCTLQQAQGINAINIDSNSKIKLTKFGDMFVSTAGVEKEMKKSFDAYINRKSKRLSDQITFLKGKSNKSVKKKKSEQAVVENQAKITEIVNS
jgi:lipopolysaccharide export LptBFGC system permease protein LptF